MHVDDALPVGAGRTWQVLARAADRHPAARYRQVPARQHIARGRIRDHAGRGALPRATRVEPMRRAEGAVRMACQPSQVGIRPGFSMTALTMPLARRSGASGSAPSGISSTCERPLRRLIRASPNLRSRCSGKASARMSAWSRGRIVGPRSVTSAPQERHRLCSTTILSSDLPPTRWPTVPEHAQPRVNAATQALLALDAASRFSGSAIAADSASGSRETRTIHSSTCARVRKRGL
jgi:hypothetical protein